MAVLLIPFIIGYILLLRILAYKEPKGFRLKYFLYLTLVPFITLILIEMYRVIIIGTTPFVISVYNQFFNNETRTFI
jgi:hypothetical protein